MPETETKHLMIEEQVVVACDEMIRRVSSAMRADDVAPGPGNRMIDAFLDARAVATETLRPAKRVLC